jgi:galactose-1-phosphate uridylyltransferase
MTCDLCESWENLLKSYIGKIPTQFFAAFEMHLLVTHAMTEEEIANKVREICDKVGVKR